MNNPFKTNQQNSGLHPNHNDGAETPYRQAKAEWDDRIGNARVQARNWRIAALFSLFITMGVLILFAITLPLRKHTLFIAQITDTGQVVNVAPLKKYYTPTQAMKAYFVKHFIKLTRRLTLDPVLTKKNWTEAYQLSLPASEKKITQHIKNNQSLEKLGKQTIMVTVNYVNFLSGHTFVAHWIEKQVDRNGNPISQKEWKGMFTLAMKPPKTEHQLLKNPLGLYVVDFSASNI